MKKVYFITISVVIFTLLLFALVKSNSFNLSLMLNRFDLNDVKVLESSINSNGNEFKIIKTSSPGHSILLVYMEKIMCFWVFSHSEDKIHPNTGMAVICWMRNAGIRRFEFDDDPLFAIEWHNLYYGDNAIKLIEFLPDQIPQNVTVSINQSANEYYIHVISFGEPDLLNNFHLHKILLENKCISAT